MVVNVDGWLADSAWSYEVGNVSPEAKKLLQVTREAMYKGIEKAVIGNRLGDIGAAVQKHAEDNGYSVVREFVGHGIGQEMHEDPQVLHYGKPGRGLRIQEGMVFTIEPMINMGKKNSLLTTMVGLRGQRMVLFQLNMNTKLQLQRMVQ